MSTHRPLPPVGERAPWPGAPLRYGHSGAHVAELQHMLRYLGHSVTESGRYDGRTTEAVRLRQRDAKLHPDGIADYWTWRYLADLVERVQPAPSYVAGRSAQQYAEKAQRARQPGDLVLPGQSIGGSTSILMLGGLAAGVYFTFFR